MQKSFRFLLSALILGAFLLSACGSAIPPQDDSPGGSAGTSSEVVFTGTVQSMGGAQWLISGQSIELDGSTAVDTGIQVGDNVRVEANVSPDGVVLALKIESSLPDDDSNANDANSNDDNANVNGDDGNLNDNTNGADDNGNANANSNDGMDDEDEVFGVVESITTDSITIGGVTYTIASFTEFNNIISVGDQVKIHVIVNADGTLSIREIEKSTAGDDDNSNSNGDDSNGNSNDDDSNDNSNDDNSNDDDDDDDDNSNSNSNDNDDDDDDDDDNSNDNS